MRRLEQRFLNELVILGVHAAKFPNEKDKDNLYNAVKRYELDHPVINDVNMEVARAYEFRAWPTLWFIDPQGKLIGKHEGEMSYESLEDLVTRMVAEFEANGLLKRSPPPSIPNREPDTGLSFPGKVFADPSGRLFICDTNHNRILVTNLDGEVQQIIGNGDPGLEDGPFANTAFDHPQGAVLDGEVLYVADTENPTPFERWTCQRARCAPSPGMAGREAFERAGCQVCLRS